MIRANNIDYREITDVKYGEFTYNGERWTMKEARNSASGCYFAMTNGKITIQVNKKDVYNRAGHAVMKKLFCNM